LSGGVLTIPKDVPEDIEREIWDVDGYLETGEAPIGRIVGLMDGLFDIDRVRRCFSGQRD
jgi:hypothetical protein